MRGGKREGAGAKRRLDAGQRIKIGIRCESLAKKCARADLQSKINSKYDPSDADKSLKAIRAVPPNLIRKSDGKTARQIAYELSQGKVPESGYPESVLEAARHFKDRRENLDGGDGNGPTPIGRSFPLRRAYRHRQEVIAKVAVWASQKFGRVVSPRQIESCWKEYRRVFKPDTDNFAPPV